MAMLKLLLRGLAFVTAGFCSWGASSQEINPGLSRARELIVMLETKVPDGVRYGAGIVIGRDEKRIYVATAGHLVRSAQGGPGAISVFFRPLPKMPLEGVVLPGRESGVDLAVVAVSPKDASGIDKCAFPFDTLRGPPGVKRGEDVLAIGNPNGSAWVIPVLPDKFAEREGDELIFQSSFIAYGNSGGALVDRVGRLVGMVTKDQPPFGRALGIDAVLRLAKAWGHPVELYPRTASGGTALHGAAEAGDLATVQRLRQSCIGANERDRRNATALHFAASNGRVEAIRELLRAGADVEARDVDSDTPLVWAAEKGQLESAKALLSAKANVSTRRAGESRDLADQYSPLFVAIKGQDLKFTRLLLSHGANVDGDYIWHARKSFSFGPGSKLFIEELIRAGAKPNSDDLSTEDIPTLRLFLSVDRELNNSVGWEGFLRAIRRRDLGAVQLFLVSGVRPIPGKNRRWFMMSPIHSAARFAKGDANLRIVDELLKYKADVNELDDYNMTPLLSACLEVEKEMMHHLVKRGGSVSRSIGTGESEVRGSLQWCLWKMIDSGDSVLVGKLLADGVAIRDKDGSWSAEDAALRSGNPQIMQLVRHAKVRVWP